MTPAEALLHHLRAVEHDSESNIVDYLTDQCVPSGGKLAEVRGLMYEALDELSLNADLVLTGSRLDGETWWTLEEHPLWTELHAEHLKAIRAICREIYQGVGPDETPRAWKARQDALWDRTFELQVHAPPLLKEMDILNFMLAAIPKW